jgi:hypothetical protein
MYGSIEWPFHRLELLKTAFRIKICVGAHDFWIQKALVLETQPSILILQYRYCVLPF